MHKPKCQPPAIEHRASVDGAKPQDPSPELARCNSDEISPSKKRKAGSNGSVDEASHTDPLFDQTPVHQETLPH